MSWAEKYHASYVPIKMEQWSKDLVRVVQPGQEVLDLACGTGVVARDAAALAGTEGRVVGIDKDSKMLEIARSLPKVEGAKIEWREGDVAAMPFGEGEFDVGLFQFTLMFMRDKAAMLKETRRVLRADGRLALSVWVSGDYDQTLLKLLSQYVDAEEIRFIIWDYGDTDWLGEQLREAGFGIQSLEQSSKISHHRSMRQSLEMIADWRPVMANLAGSDFDTLVADMEKEFGEYIDDEGFHLPEQALTAVGKAV
jgi:ubiquinone/menaquinone biosynthesis C-methylase UbiE